MFESTIKIGHTNRINSYSLNSFGNWNPKQPLSNAKDKQYRKMAQSLDIINVFDITFDKLREFSCFGIFRHDLQPGSNIGIKVYNDFTKSTIIYEDIYQVHDDSIMFDDYEWEDTNFWFGVFTNDDYRKLNNNFVVFLPVLPAAVIEVTILNTSGTFSFGRLFVGETFQPSINMEWSSGLGINDSTSVEQSLGGVEYFNKVDTARTLECTLPSLNDSESSKVLELARRGVAEEMVVSCGDYSNLISYYQQTFPCRFENINPLTCKYINRISNSIKFKEII